MARSGQEICERSAVKVRAGCDGKESIKTVNCETKEL